MVGLIVPVPKKVAESGYIRIVADNNGNESLSPGCRWEILAYEYDIDKQCCKGEYFPVSRKEVETWISNRSEEGTTIEVQQRRY